MTAGTALLFDDRASLAAAMTQVIGPNGAALQVLAQAARQRALKVYTWEAVTDAYEALLLRLAR